jgi:hypothetical protein
MQNYRLVALPTSQNAQTTLLGTSSIETKCPGLIRGIIVGILLTYLPLSLVVDIEWLDIRNI